MGVDITLGSADGRSAGKASAGCRAVGTDRGAVNSGFAVGDGRAAGSLVDMAFGPAHRMETAVRRQTEETVELAAVHGAVGPGVESAFLETARVVSTA